MPTPYYLYYFNKYSKFIKHPKACWTYLLVYNQNFEHFPTCLHLSFLYNENRNEKIF